MHHAIWYKKIYSYTGVMEALSGFSFDVRFISFDDIRNDSSVLDDIDCVLNMSDAYISFSGGPEWDSAVISCIRKYSVDQGGGFIGVGQLSACQGNGKFFTLYDVLGVDQEKRFTMHTNEYNWESHDHFITEQLEHEDRGECVNHVYALLETTILREKDLHVNLAGHDYGQGRSVYMNGLPFSFENARLLYRAIFYAAHQEHEMKKWYSDNYNVEINVYSSISSYCVVNNTYEPQKTTIYTGNGENFDIALDACGIRWFSI